jgi:DNA-binding NarL/FixJ family response regulator
MSAVDEPQAPEASSQMEGPTMVAFSPLQFEVLKRLRQNMQHTAIAHELGLSASELGAQIRQILTRISARDRAALLMIVGLATAIS